MPAHGSFLAHRDFLWLRRALWLAIATLAVYVLHDPVGGRNGGTWAGYGLGGLGALMILWLAWLGVRKRSFAGRTGARAGVSAAAGPVEARQTLKGWTSAHVYLGLALLVVATLHTGFEFGWNVHTLAYALMVVVIGSGVFGVFAYARYPVLMSENLGGQSPDRIRRTVAEIDATLKRLATRLPDALAATVRLSLERTRLGGGAWTLLRGSSADCATAAALGQARAAAAGDHGPGDQGVEPAAMTELLSLLSRKADLCMRLRRDAAYKARMDAMLWVHAPVTVALIAALIAHVFIVFFYW